jgi:hypothetical protein
MTEPNPYDLQAILDKGETAESMMIQEEINAIMFAPYDRGNNKPKAKKKKPKLKQTTLKQAFKNAIPKNFQGFPEKNCIAVMLEGKAELVYCPKGYGKATRQKYGKSECAHNHLPDKWYFSSDPILVTEHCHHLHFIFDVFYTIHVQPVSATIGKFYSQTFFSGGYVHFQQAHDCPSILHPLRPSQ